MDFDILIIEAFVSHHLDDGAATLESVKVRVDYGRSKKSLYIISRRQILVHSKRSSYDVCSDRLESSCQFMQSPRSSMYFSAYGSRSSI